MTQTDSNPYLSWVVINFISTSEISVVVVIDRLRPRPIPTNTESGSISTTTNHNQVYHYKAITTQIDYDQESFWVIIDR